MKVGEEWKGHLGHFILVVNVATFQYHTECLDISVHLCYEMLRMKDTPVLSGVAVLCVERSCHRWSENNETWPLHSSFFILISFPH